MTKDNLPPLRKSLARQAILIGTSPMLMLLGWLAIFKADSQFSMLFVFFMLPTLIAGGICLAGNFWAWVIMDVRRKALRFFVLLCCNLPLMACVAWNALFAANQAPRPLMLSIALFIASMIFAMYTLWVAADEPEVTHAHPIDEQP